MITGKDYFKSLGGEYEEQKIFSTGNDELDDILTEVYFSGISDGYDYAQKEFSRLGGLKNKIKAVPRHIKRYVNIGKGAVKIGQMAPELSAEEVKAVATVARAAKTPGTKIAKTLSKNVKKGRISKAQAEQLTKDSETWSRIHKNGKGATRNIFGYSEPEITEGLRKMGLA